MNYSLHSLGDQAILIEFTQEVNEVIHEQVQGVKDRIAEKKYDWVVEIVPAFASIAVHYDIRKLLAFSDPYNLVEKELSVLLDSKKSFAKRTSREINIPVFYGGKSGPDLEQVAKHNAITAEEVIELHTKAEYTVYMLGFAPGFPYIGGLNEKLATPRKSKPRLQIPVGSVGIAGQQTGVYPIETPGGWQLIGQTPEALFRPMNEEEPTLLQAGDKIRFYAISEEEFYQRQERNK
ncbi:5-oxoprolinase subunit PxpB [Jeotgalibacillus campisalis]|uniref:Allophanate hydrolase subunit 1 n=1 Tax=Jeotgalibacillus campisalis TaxID=220754 RepID=A0A0C2RRQ7_9BACL|nr:5-oxoprolinase subunit PxpB [Jeotgalibacillus campisalis]KIL52935.1 allophanate hydrolase subunit 1 [Jeotgalibacillus campisalis]